MTRWSRPRGSGRGRARAYDARAPGRPHGGALRDLGGRRRDAVRAAAADLDAVLDATRVRPRASSSVAGARLDSGLDAALAASQMDTAVRVDETGSGALVGGGGFGSGRERAEQPRVRPTARDSVPRGGSGRGSPTGPGAASASAPSFATAQMVFAGFVAAVLARCVVAPRGRRARLAGSSRPGAEEALAVAALSASARLRSGNRDRARALRSSGSRRELGGGDVGDASRVTAPMMHGRL